MNFAALDLDGIDESRLREITNLFPPEAADRWDMLREAQTREIENRRLNANIRDSLRLQKNSIGAQLAQLEKDRERSPVWTAEHEAQLTDKRAEFEEAKARLRKHEDSAGTQIVRVPPERRDFQRLRMMLMPGFDECFSKAGRYARFDYREVDTGKYTLKTIRAEVDKTLEALVALEKSSRSAAEALEEMIQIVDATAAKGAPNIEALVRHRVGRIRGEESIRWPARNTATGREPMSSEFLVWLHADALKKRLADMISAELDGKNSVGAAERVKREAELKARFLELQYIEAELSHQTENVVWRRLHPLAYLGIERVADAERPERIPKNTEGGENFVPDPNNPGTSPTLGVPLDQVDERGRWK